MLVAVLVVGLGLTGIAIARENNASVAPADPLPDGAVSLFADDVQPKDVAGSENTDSIELGLRFTTSQTGTITGLRFFRTIGDFTAHGGRLWSANGEILGRLRFPPRLNPGWQYADFRSPVPVSAGDVLVASYHTSRDFAADTNYFADHLLANGPLSTVGTGASGSGVFAIGDHAIFPSSVYRASNYWVDPAFLQASDDSPVVPPPAPTPSPPAPTATPSPTPSPSPSPSPRPTPSPSPTPSPTPSPSPSPTPSPTPPPAPPPPPAPVPPPPAPVPPPAPGGTLAPNTIPAPGQVGFRGDRATLRVIDSAANAPAGTRWSGSILEVTGQGVILDGVYVKGAITYGGSGGTLTIRNSVVEARSGAWAVIDVRNDSGNLIVSDSTIVWPANVPNPSNSWGNGAIHGDSAMTLIRNDISGTPDGIQQGRGDVRFEQNYIHDLRRYGDTHNDGIQLYGGPRVRVLYNRIELNGYQGNQNAALFLSDDGNGFTSPEIIGNYLSGGGFQLRLESGVQGAVVVGNRFGPLNGGWGEILISNGVTIARFEDNRTSSGALISL